jgi:hypothetical protein
MNWKIAFLLLAALSVGVMIAESALGQGGTGRENTNSSKPAPKPTTPPRKPSGTTHSTPPAFRTQNPPHQVSANSVR